MLNLPQFFETARERYAIKLMRDQQFPKPWTEDPAFLGYRFCNVFREDDTTTQWIRRTITPAGYGEAYVGAIIIARWFNRIETLEKLLAPPQDSHYWQENLLYCWSQPGHWRDWTDKMRKRLVDVKPLVTGAYIIKTPNGKNKLEGLLWCFENILPNNKQLTSIFREEGHTLEEATKLLTTFPFLGPFMAYEIVTDLNQTIMADAPDKYEWANPGPGCTRGIGRVAVGVPDFFSRGNKKDLAEMLQLMQEILLNSHDDDLWPAEWPEWDMRTVEHWLCEFDKHQRITLGEGTPKQLYKGAK